MLDLYRCSKCGETKPSSDFYRKPNTPRGVHSWCKSCMSDRHKERYSSNENGFRDRMLLRVSTPAARNQKKMWRESAAGKRKDRNSALLRKSGITIEMYEAAFASQGGRCAICHTDSPGGVGNRLHADHCHETGKFRGLLCTNCNRGLGHFKDSEERMLSAIKYLRSVS